MTVWIITDTSLCPFIISISMSSMRQSHYFLIELDTIYPLPNLLLEITGSSVMNGLNKSKSSIPPLFNQFEVLSFTADKTECFVQKFSSNSILDSSDASLPNFPLRMET